jgi:hypothetical protein
LDVTLSEPAIRACPEQAKEPRLRPSKSSVQKEHFGMRNCLKAKVLGIATDSLILPRKRTIGWLQNQCKTSLK